MADPQHLDPTRPLMHLTIESEQEVDGRWLAEVPELPGVLAYGATRDEALAKAQVLALRVLAERIEHREGAPEPISISIAA
jgi:predicted RNase H-like HicB family nuclease